ncbi:3-isopropylmalate dehydrogenase [Brachyspira hampsonii 30446]|uniref:3-isopropylmalate dehydrogenase n=3 Tax=Brachyspira hampsonii TaxID=1287055 RepID=A0A2U4FI45_9SPIR|nr:3-isopropylmalate dehydrogenase [Brachyspira hampsonii]EKV56881.1 3-isopropylmalate dehydrogenase [Brachyspira hampsonii 30446]OEJ18170.1 3-isopropylmalate dehydrogenase [Brachyspira hampsonii]
MEKNIVVIKGDGVGPEIVDKAIDVLNRIAEKYSHKFNLEYVDMGGCSIDKYGVPLTDENLEKCIKSDSVLLGSVGGPKWDNVAPENRPERGLLKLRKEMKLYANIRPIKILKSLEYASPLKESICKDVIDFVIVRELTGGVYFGEHKFEVVNGVRQATDLMVYKEDEILRIGKVAFELARNLKKPLTSVDKANVLHTSKLWREIMNNLSKEYSDVSYNDMYVDNAAMQITSNPSQFGVIVTENMFGDILSDEASIISGSIGMAPSASLSDGSVGMYEPIHGSAPDIAGKDLANPIGTILSLAMMLRYSFKMEKEAETIEKAVYKAIDEGYRTLDIMPKHNMMTYLYKQVRCSEMGDIIVSNI